MRKELDAEKIREVLVNLSMIFMITHLKCDDLKKAANMDFKDYEDAVLSSCAVRIKADYIITRNIMISVKAELLRLIHLNYSIE